MYEERPRSLDPSARPAGVSADVGTVRVVVFVSMALALLVFARQLFLGGTFALRDFLQYTWPARQVLVEALRAGRLPEWNGGIAFGTPFAAMPTNGVAYPPQWIAALFPLPLGIHVVMALHLFAAGVGTGLLARRFGAGALGAALAAGALMTSGYVASNEVNGTFLSIAWVPWVGWAADRLATLGVETAASKALLLRRTAVLSAVIAGQVLSGDPSSALTAGLIAVAVTLARSNDRLRAGARLVIAGAGAVLLAAAVVAPSFALLGATSRTLDDSLQWSMHPWRLAELIWPDVLGDPIEPVANLARAVANTGNGNVEPRWAYSVFVGGPVLALAVMGAFLVRSLRGVLVASLLMLALALGKYSPLYVAYRAVFPIERILHFPEKHVLGAVVLWCALAGVGLTRLRERLHPRVGEGAGGIGSHEDTLGTRFVVGACVPTGVLVAVFFALRPFLYAPIATAASAVQPAPVVEAQQALAHMFTRGAAAFVLAAIAATLLAAARPWMAAAGVALLVGHAGWLGWQMSPVVDATRVRSVPALLANVPAGEDGVRRRVLRTTGVEWATWAERMSPQAAAAYTHDTAATNIANRYGFGAFPGYEGFHTVAFDAFWAAVVSASMSLGGFTSLYAIDYIALPNSGAARSFLPVIGTAEQGWSLLAAPGPRPRAFVAQRWTRMPSSDALAASFAPGRDRDPGYVLLSGTSPDDAPIAPTAPDTEPLVPCSVRMPAPEDVHLDCWSPYGGFAVFADELMPGWQATVDGAPSAIVRADLLFQAVRIGPGRHAIRFRYRTPLLRLGIAVSVLSWLAFAGLLVFTSERRHSKPG